MAAVDRRLPVTGDLIPPETMNDLTVQLTAIAGISGRPRLCLRRR